MNRSVDVLRRYLAMVVEDMRIRKQNGVAHHYGSPIRASAEEVDAIEEWLMQNKPENIR